MTKSPIIQPGLVRLRRIREAIDSDTMPAFDVIGRRLVADPIKGVNGRPGFSSGKNDEAVSDIGSATITFPNGAGADGILHRDRLLIITNGKSRSLGGNAMLYEGGSYRAGDEWFEMTWAQPGTEAGDLMGNWTPYQAVVTPTQIQLSLWDGWVSTKKNRETAFGYFRHSPHDVVRALGGAWRGVIAEGFFDSAARFPSDSGTPVLSADGKWWTKHVVGYSRPDTIELRGATDSYVRAHDSCAIQTQEGENRWRVELSMVMEHLAGSVLIELWPVGVTPDTIGGQVVYQLNLTVSTVSVTVTEEDGTTISGTTLANYRADAHALSIEYGRYLGTPGTGIQLGELVPPVALAIEQVGRWVIFSVGGRVLTIAPAAPEGQALIPWVRTLGSAWTMVDQIVVKQRVDLLDKGTEPRDRRTGGLPVTGGLRGTYYDLNGLAVVAGYDESTMLLRALDPVLEPYGRRTDSTIAFPFTTPPAWQITGPFRNQYFGVIWAGSIYLGDIDTRDYQLRLKSFGGSARVWVGTSRWKEEYIDAWDIHDGPDTVTGGSLIDHLGQQDPGWYPILIEYMHLTGGGGIQLQYATSDAPSTWHDVTSALLSPQGIFDGLAARSSHYDQIVSILRDFGLQARFEPKALESGLFPGQLIAAPRVGWDTDATLEQDEALSEQLTISVDTAADAIVADAAGVPDPRSNEQQTVEVYNLVELLQHMWISTEAVSLPDLSNPSVIFQRLASMLATSNAQADIQAQPSGKLQRVKEFGLPVTDIQGDILRWRAGDGIRLVLPRVTIEDDYPRQILQVSRDWWPQGLGRPQASFRQLLRDPVRAIREISNTLHKSLRTYQGQARTAPASHGGTVVGSSMDEYTRAGFPTDPAKATKAILSVGYMDAIPSASNFEIEINGVATGHFVNEPGNYDVTEFMRAAAGQQQMYARLTGGGGTKYHAILDLRVLD